MQYWEVWYADGRVCSSTDYAPHELPPGRVIAVIQPGARERTGWKDRLLTTNHVFYRSDLDCWTEHDPAPLWPLLEMVDHAHAITCYRMGKWIGEFPDMRKLVDARYKELTHG